MGRLHQEVTVEYVRRLLRGQVKLRDKEEQLKASATMKDQAESLHHLFLKMVRDTERYRDRLGPPQRLDPTELLRLHRGPRRST